MTKQKKLVRNVIKGFLSLAVLSLFTLVISCSHDDEETPQKSEPIVVTFKAEASAGSNLTSVVYTSPSDPTGVTMQGVSGTAWTNAGQPTPNILRKFPFKITVKATGANASSTLKLQAFENGVLKKEVTTTGQDLKAEITYN